MRLDIWGRLFGAASRSVAHLEALDAGRELQEALAQPIGKVRVSGGCCALEPDHRRIAGGPNKQRCVT